ncbi:MAG: HD-GYP domain-containing protein [Ktedonobacteraceae bacterium]
MSTQPLLQESTPGATELVLTPHPLEESLGLVNPLRDLELEESSLFELPQETQVALERIEYRAIHALPLLNNLREEFSEIFSSLIPELNAKDPQLYHHSLRVHTLAISFATTTLHLSEAETLKVGLAAFFHDIGKMNISDAILHKASGLTRQEYEIIKNHPAYGAEILSQFKLIKSVVPSLYHHHERIDGKGYPEGLRGNAIPLGARLIAIVDAFEVMTSQRIYQKSRTPFQAIEELYANAGTQFDAELVELFHTFFEISPYL